jgi:hypothetical protein
MPSIASSGGDESHANRQRPQEKKFFWLLFFQKK